MVEVAIGHPGDGEARPDDDVVTVRLHVRAPDRETAVERAGAALQLRLDPSQRQQVLAVQAVRRLDARGA